jgi:6-pyruvoyltetrahydropterin/6-carboxytetrahydropterin synthase
VPALTRRVSFTASHRYWRGAWSAARNTETFGRATAAHGHDYVCDVTVAGPVDDVTGMIVDLGLLDRILDAEVRTRFHRADINSLPEFADGKLIPTCENLARFVYERVDSALAGAATLARVVVRESDTLSAEFTGRD